MFRYWKGAYNSDSYCSTETHNKWHVVTPGSHAGIPQKSPSFYLQLSLSGSLLCPEFPPRRRRRPGLIRGGKRRKWWETWKTLIKIVLQTCNNITNLSLFLFNIHLIQRAVEEAKRRIFNADLSRKENKVLTQLEIEARDRDQRLLEQASALRMEQEEEIKLLNSVGNSSRQNYSEPVNHRLLFSMDVINTSVLLCVCVCVVSTDDYGCSVSSHTWCSDPGEETDPGGVVRGGEAPGRHDGGGTPQGLGDWGGDWRAAQKPDDTVKRALQYTQYLIRTDLIWWILSHFANLLASSCGAGGSLLSTTYILHCVLCLCCISEESSKFSTRSRIDGRQKYWTMN